jgi:2'-5' RNA ligase
MGSFGDLWWAGMRESVPLTAVARRIRRALAENDIPFDKKKFSPHITLIRKAAGELPGIEPEPVSMNVHTISLMRSDRGRNGMIYTELGSLEADV